MRLATSTNLLYLRPDGTRFDLPKTLEMVSAAGFRIFDLNFYDWSLPGTEFLTDRWEWWIDDVAECAARLGVTFGQCHAYFYPFLDETLSEEKKAYHKRLQQRSFDCCRRPIPVCSTRRPDGRAWILSKIPLPATGNTLRLSLSRWKAGG